MIKNRIYRILTNSSGNVRFRFFLVGLVYLVIDRINLCRDYLTYNFTKIRNNKISHDRIIVNGNIMQIDFNDNGISKELYIHKKREHFSTEFMRKFISENDTIIDIGANIGYYVLLESRLAYSGKIYAIEPIPSNIYMLKRNVQLNNRNIFIHRQAVSDKKGKSKMYIYDKCNWCSFTKNLEDTVRNEIDVQTTTLDDFVTDYNIHPTFIRMDVEGHEYQIIKGATRVLEKYSPLKLYIELHPHLMTADRFTELLDILKDNKFKVKAVFFEIEAHNYRSINMLNKLRKIMGIPEFGFIGNNYDDIRMMSKYMYASSVFFER